MTTTVRTSAFTEPDRPKNLQIRYVTVGGTYLDVTGTGSIHKNHRWHCHGCQDGNDIYDQHRLSQARDQANTHANNCRAIPLT
ncbi:hypothetical protein AB0F11_13670 [Streptomyces sp. NPDC032472]|uniref:hypothetical protein n=1 Tax=Streptomyces sp. NPDC032472 TaxID=3155018 RepID=UPI003407D4B0